MCASLSITTSHVQRATGWHAVDDTKAFSRQPGIQQMTQRRLVGDRLALSR